jgi:hypothetical protein
MPIKLTRNLKPVKTAKEEVKVANMHTPADLHNLISKRAYEIFLQRGEDWGSELTDWLLAEQEITAAVQTSAQTLVQTLATEPALITTRTQKTTKRPASVKVTEKRRSTTTRARKKPAPEI